MRKHFWVCLFTVGMTFGAEGAHAAADAVAPGVTEPPTSVDPRFHRETREQLRDQEPQTQVPAVDEIERRLMRTSMRWGRLRVARADGPLDLGYLNQRAPFVFQDSPLGLKAANASYDYRVAEFITGLFAGAVYLADFAYVATRLSKSNHPWDKTDTGIGLGMLAGGLAFHLTSSLLGNAANDRLARAVSFENEHVVVHTLRPPPGAHASLVVLPQGGAMAQAVISF